MMKRILTVFMMLVVLTVVAVVPAYTVAAQNAAVHCGDIIQGELTKPDEVQGYPIVLSTGDKITVSGQADGTSQTVFGIVLDSPAGIRAFPHNNSDVKLSSSPILVTGRTSAYGVHTIYVFNNDKIGGYRIGIGCELHDGVIVAAGDSSYVPQPVTRPQTITVPISTMLSNSLKEIQCGEVFTTEFTQNDQIHSYSLEMAPGDLSFQVNVAPYGDGLYTSMLVFDPAGKYIKESYSSVEPAPSLIVTVSSPGNYRIVVSNSAIGGTGGVIQYPGFKTYMGGVGIYTILVSCTLKGNQIVSPDPSKIEQAAQAQSETQPVSSTEAVSVVNPTNFDAEKAIHIPMIASVPMTGATTPTGNESYAYAFEANSSDILALSFNRLSGNLNLGLVVMSPDNKVVFQASLVTSSEMTTKLTLPSAGTYTIGVYRIDLLPPDAPEATAFQVQGTLNP